MDISSEIIHSLLPLFMVTTLGTSVLMVGLVEGLAESLALITKIFSGALSDFLGKRKKLAVLGYALGALTKPLFAIAETINLILLARLLDRVGKGIRGAPRDALIADITPPSIRGAAFGLRQSLDTVGGILGPLLAVGLMLLWSNNFRAIFRWRLFQDWLLWHYSLLALKSLITPTHTNVTIRFAAKTCAALTLHTGGWSLSARYLLWRVSVKHFWCCGHNKGEFRLL